MGNPMKLFKKRAARLLGAGLLASGALIATVSPAQAEDQDSVTITICAWGNYTAYAKVVATDGSLNTDLSRVAQGTCHTDVPFFTPSNPHVTIDVYVFGIYNTSGKGFDAVGNGATGPFASIDPNFGETYYAEGTTTDPSVDD
jgi:hypothetical protein